jgi:hypothetical protein
MHPGKFAARQPDKLPAKLRRQGGKLCPIAKTFSGLHNGWQKFNFLALNVGPGHAQ